MKNYFFSPRGRALAVLLLIAMTALDARRAAAQSDSCAGAATVGVGTYPGNNFGATTDGSSNCGGSADVWYYYNPPSDGISVFTTCDGSPGMDTIMSLHPLCPGTFTNQLICNDQDPFCATNGNASSFSSEVDGTAFYYLRVAGFSGAQGGYTLQITHASNNSCANAPLLAIPGTYNRSSLMVPAASTDGSSTCGGTNDVWYRVIPNANGVLTADTCGSSYDTVLSIHTAACPGNTANQIACNDNGGCGGGSSKVQIPVTAGTTYRIRVAGVGGATGNFTLNLSLGPVNDLCSTAQVINTGTFVGNTATATSEPGEYCSPAGSFKDVWYSYTPTSDEFALLTLCGASFDTVLSVHTACPVVNINQVTCNNDSFICMPQSKLGFLAKAGTAYKIRVAGNGPSASGSFGLNLSTVNCGGVTYSENFELGLNGWTINNSYGASGNGLWHLTSACSAAMTGHSASTALAYMSDGTCDYSGGSPTSGAAVSPIIDLTGPVITPVLLSMNYYIETEWMPAIMTDQLRVEVSSNGFSTYTTVADNLSLIDQRANATGQWGTLVADLSSFAGQLIQIRVTFDTVDAIGNAFDGFYVDDVTICGPPNTFSGWEDYE